MEDVSLTPDKNLVDRGMIGRASRRLWPKKAFPRRGSAGPVPLSARSAAVDAPSYVASVVQSINGETLFLLPHVPSGPPTKL